ncbi:hypothetical protein JW887_05160 [Candidatus Dojkabacteria bacterium]|nr:hypothetical protein [Candidatus Dojkabacteria bacterium]
MAENFLADSEKKENNQGKQIASLNESNVSSDSVVQNSNSKSRLIKKPMSVVEKATISDGDLNPNDTSKPKRREIIRSDKKKEGLTKKLGDYLVPILVFIVFMLIVIFVYVPFSQDIIDTRKEIEGIQQKIDQNNDKINALNAVDLTELNSKMNLVNKVVRDEYDVSALAEDVETIAIENNLRSSELSISDYIMDETDTEAVDLTTGMPGYANSITGPYAYYGLLDDVTNFLKDLRENSPTILTIGYVEMQRYSSSPQEQAISSQEYWSVEIIISGYTTAPVMDAEIYDPFERLDMFDIITRITKRVENNSGNGGSNDNSNSDEENSNDENTENNNASGSGNSSN